MTWRIVSSWLASLLVVCGPSYGEISVEFEHIKHEQRGGTLIAKLDNPPRNLMNAKMVQELHALIAAVDADDSVRVLVLTGNMDGVFIQHYDVSELTGLAAMLQQGTAPPGMDKVLHATNQAFLKLEALRKPVIAAINGLAMGGGFELALACDMRFLAEGGRVGLPEATMGILPGAGGTQRLSRLLGPGKALELMLVGEIVDADTALSLGMVNRVLSPGTLLEETLAYAERLAVIPPEAIAEIKTAVREGGSKPLEEALFIEQNGFWTLMKSEEAARRMREYVEGGQDPGTL